MLPLLGTEACIFFSVLGFCLVYFRLIGHLVNLDMTKKRLGSRLSFSVANAFLALIIESSYQGRSNLTVISLITLVLIFELYVMHREKHYFYLYFHTYWLTSLQLQAAYLFSSAIVNLFISHTWITGSSQHRYAIFSTTMIMGTLIFSFQLYSPKSFTHSLGKILKERSHTYLLAVYTISATTVLAVSGSLVSQMLYTDVPQSIKVIMYPDIIMKNCLILGGSLLIIFYLVLREIAHKETQVLNEELETEREFRETFHSDSLLSYCANITKNCFVKEKSEFILPDENGYRESILDFIMETVHPEDMEKIADLISLDHYEQQLDADPHYSFKIRLAPKPILALAGFRLSEEMKKELRADRDWIWVEFHITIIKETGTNDILTYVSLNNVDTEMMEREKLAQAANTDALTGLLNRSGFETLLKEHLHSYPNGGTLFMIDMDYFKQVNDKLGHPVGDLVLQDTAKILHSVFRESDLLCRLGGDEFCAFAKNLYDKNLILKRAGELEEKGRRTYTSPDGTLSVSVSFSIGAAIHHNGSKISYDQLYEQADHTLYQAKEAGRNTYRLIDLE
ncbi:MAG: GGDEF domain-containing protein [Lachnospiraceae bacterium]|nr:GGDEF domain-containing protein [Lachnospiraceae bacterium]